MVYYIDPQNGNDANQGASEQEPYQTVNDRSFLPGDIILFKRGTIIKKGIRLCNGSEQGYVTYSAYGEGPDPVINPSVEANDPALWKEYSTGIWQYVGALPREMCNIVFNDGKSCGNLRWSVNELKATGEWYYTLLGHSINDYRWDLWGQGTLYLACDRNPTERYEFIELVTWGDRMAMTGKEYIKIEHFTMEKCGVHAFQTSHAHHIEIRHCTFRLIGGGVFDLPSKVRLGNAVEFWNGAYDCLVEHCYFENIYDSGFTHQGSGDDCWVSERLTVRNNVFARCGMAAYEWRGLDSRDVVFENNLCLQGGGAFTMQGEESPRRTEIPFTPSTCVYVLIWLLEREIKPGEVYCTIRNNIFCQAPPYGAAIASGLEPRFMEQFVIEKNCYFQSGDSTLIYMNGKAYSRDEFDTYRRETGKDSGSMLFKSEDIPANIIC
jgi:hypothetical protein